MSFEILTDSCCDFPSGLYVELGVHCAPLTVEFRGETYDDRNDDSLKAFYDGLRNGEAAKTAATNPQRWAAEMEKILRKGKDVLVMAFSSGLSTTYNCARIAAEEVGPNFPERKILIVDTLCASMGQGLLVYYAQQKYLAGMPIEEVRDWVEKNKRHLCHWFTVDDLMYLKRGGRINAATAMIGTMLQVKPVLHVDDEGHLVNVGKARGRKAAIRALMEKAAELGVGFENNTMFISHGDCLEDAQYLAQMLKAEMGVRNVIISYVGSVIGSHAGPGTLALFFLGQNR